MNAKEFRSGTVMLGRQAFSRIGIARKKVPFKIAYALVCSVLKVMFLLPVVVTTAILLVPSVRDIVELEGSDHHVLRLVFMTTLIWELGYSVSKVFREKGKAQ